MKIILLAAKDSWFEKELDSSVLKLKEESFNDVECIGSHQNLRVGGVVFF